MTRFEYKTVAIPMKRKNRFSMYEFDKEVLNETLRKLGEQGWEMVTTLDRNMSGSMMESLMVFKRKVG